MPYEFMIVLVAVAILTVALVGLPRNRPIRELSKDPAVQARRQLDRRERKRWLKLAQSEQYIADPEESKQAEAEARVSAETMRRVDSFSLRGLILALLPVPLMLLVERRVLAFAVVYVLLILGLYKYWVRMRTKLERTAEINDWNLQWDDREPG